MNTSITVLSAVAVLTLGTALTPRGDVDALLAAYETAEQDWKQALREAESAERRKLRKEHPAAAYWDRFDAAAQAGQGRALLWMATHLRDKGLRSSALKEEKPLFYGRIFERHAGEDWIGDVLEKLPREKRYLGEERLASFFLVAIERNEDAEIRAQAMFRLGLLLLESDDAAERESGQGWLKKASELDDTDFGMKARAEFSKPVTGEPAPDFTGVTVDGVEFKLSDYRGKVVLLDFFGFW